MKNLVFLMASTVFISGCTTMNESRNISSDGSLAPVTAPAIASLNAKSYSCNELIKIQKTKIKNIPEVNSNPLQIDFQLTSVSEITDVKVRISEAGKLSEVFSSDGQVVKGIISSEAKKPLAGLMIFTLSEENGDRFEFFVAPSAITQDQFFAYGKISFDDDASKTTRLTCALNKGL